MKKLVTLGVVLLALVAGYIYATPYLVVCQMRTAVENNDAEALSEHIDFPALRRNLKEQKDEWTDEVVKRNAQDGNLLGVFLVSLTGALTEKLIDVGATPTVLMRLMGGETPEAGGTESPGSKQAALGPLAEATMSYDSFSRFSIRVKYKILFDPEVTFVLSRKGFGWKLTHVMFPDVASS